MRKAFTLIELLVVIAIIAILAAILFPVFAQAKLQAKKTSDLSNIKEIATATLIYTNDSDDVLFTPVDPCFTAGTTTLGVCSQYSSTGALGLDATSGDYLYWTYKLQPYSKNFQIFKSPVTTAFTSDSANGAVQYTSSAGYSGVPEASGRDWGGQNSYAYNAYFLSPVAGTGTYGPIYNATTTTASPRTAGTILYTDATFHTAAPDVLNVSGLTNTSHLINTSGSYEYNQESFSGALPWVSSYWQNLGGSYYTSNSSGTDVENVATALQNGPSTFGGKINASFLDGHAKSVSYQPLVGDVCYWSIDQEGAHPNCSN